MLIKLNFLNLKINYIFKFKKFNLISIGISLNSLATTYFLIDLR
jgi:hypothetical protein